MPKARRYRRKKRRTAIYRKKRSTKRSYGTKRRTRSRLPIAGRGGRGRRTISRTPKRKRTGTVAYTVPQPTGPYRGVGEDLLPKRYRKKMIFEDWSLMRCTSGVWNSAVNPWRVNNPVDPWPSANWRHSVRGWSSMCAYYNRYRVMGAKCMAWAEYIETDVSLLDGTFPVASGGRGNAGILLGEVSAQLTDGSNNDTSDMVQLPYIAGQGGQQPLWLEFLANRHSNVKVAPVTFPNGFQNGLTTLGATTGANTVGPMGSPLTKYPFGKPLITLYWKNNRAGYPGRGTNVNAFPNGDGFGNEDPWNLTYQCLAAETPTGNTPLGAGPYDINSPKFLFTLHRQDAQGLSQPVSCRLHVRIEYDIEFTCPNFQVGAEADLDLWAADEEDDHDETKEMIGPDGVDGIVYEHITGSGTTTEQNFNVARGGMAGAEKGYNHSIAG